MAIAVLEALGRAALHQMLAMLHRGVRVLRMPQRRDRHREQLVLAPAEDRARGRIDADPVAFEVRDADEIVGHVPEPVALARALLDLVLEVFVEGLQRLLDALALGDVDMRADETQRLAVGVAFDLGFHLDPAHLPVARADDAIFGAVFARAAVHRLDELPFGPLAILRMDAPHPVLVRLVDRLGRQSVDDQVFGRTPVAETIGEENLDAADLPDLLHPRELGFAIAQSALGPDALGGLDRGHQHAADTRRARCRQAPGCSSA